MCYSPSVATNDANASQSQKGAVIMAHNLFGNRFFSYRQPAWHKLGLVLDEALGAEAAFDRIGAYDVHLEDLQTVGGMTVPHKAIVHDGISDEEPLKVFGIVG